MSNTQLVPTCFVIQTHVLEISTSGVNMCDVVTSRVSARLHGGDDGGDNNDDDNNDMDDDGAGS